MDEKNDFNLFLPTKYSVINYGVEKNNKRGSLLFISDIIKALEKCVDDDLLVSDRINKLIEHLQQ